MISDLQKVELIQHFLEEIDDNLEEITTIEKDIHNMKKKNWEIINKTERIENFIDLCMKDQDFVDSLCDDFVKKIKNKKSKIQKFRKKSLG